MIPIKTETYLSENHDRLASEGYNDDEILAFARWNGWMEAKHSPEAAQIILGHINERIKASGSRTVLRFRLWDGDDLYAWDQKDRSCVIPGSWWDIRYIPRGVCRQRKRLGRFRFLPNGQASTGSVQVAYFMEDFQICFPEFEGIDAARHAAIEARTKRTRTVGQAV
jgi:hypothetical protein